MKAAMITGDKKIEIVQIDAPKADGYHVLMKPTAVGICGSDVHFWQVGGGQLYNKTVPGHEHAGIVVDPGCRKDLKVGDRITTIPLTTYCGRCDACLAGDFDNCTSKIPCCSQAFVGRKGTPAAALVVEVRQGRTEPDRRTLQRMVRDILHKKIGGISC